MHAEPSSNNRQPGLWETVVVPTAIGIERFFWSVAWFALIVTILFSGLLFPRPAVEGGPKEVRNNQPVQAAVGSPR